MFEPEVREILNELLTKSEAGQVKWLESEAAGMTETAPDDYVVLMPSSSINVFRILPDDVRANFLDSAGDVSLSLIPTTNEDRNLLEHVIASAKKTVEAPKLRLIHQTLDDIKNALRQEGVIGETKPRRFASF